MRYLLFTFLAHGALFFVYYGHDATPMVEDTVTDDARTPAEDHRYENTTLTPALLNLRSQDPIGYVGASIPAGCERFEGHRLLKSVINLDHEHESALVGFFDDQAGGEYFMVVNLVHGLNMSKMDGARIMRLTFEPSVERVERLNRLLGFVETLRTSQSKDAARYLDI